jgi:hypothetical protein
VPRRARTNHAACVAPRTDLEEQIAQVWRDVLALKTVGVHDNFFDLGGHSLLMVRAHEHLCRVLAQDLSITDLFEQPTISALGAFLRRGAASPALPDVQDRAVKQRTLMHRRRPIAKLTPTHPPLARPGGEAPAMPFGIRARPHPAQLRLLGRRNR